MPSKQSRYWCFTSYHDDCPKYDPSTMQYLIHGGEECPDTKRRHWQCYVEFFKPTTRSRVSKMFDGVHLEQRNGTALQAATYCKKDEQFIEYGTIGKDNSGRRSDLENIASMVANGSQSIRDVAIANPRMFVQYGRGLTILNAVTNSAATTRWREVTCEIWYGKTNLGKTRRWFDKYYDVGCYRFQYSKGGNWWDGYNGEKHILFDEFNCQVMLSEMLMWLDGYPTRLEIKGGFTYAKWETVTIISNDDPRTFYANCSTDKKNAFARRFKYVMKHIKESGDSEEEFRFDEASVGFFEARGSHAPAARA